MQRERARLGITPTPRRFSVNVARKVERIVTPETDVAVRKSNAPRRSCSSNCGFPKPSGPSSINVPGEVIASGPMLISGIVALSVSAYADHCPPLNVVAIDWPFWGRSQPGIEPIAAVIMSTEMLKAFTFPKIGTPVNVTFEPAAEKLSRPTVAAHRPVSPSHRP